MNAQQLQHASQAKAALQAHQKEIEALETQRIADALKQKNYLAKIFAQRKAEFSKEFEHVWIGGNTEIRIVQMTMPDQFAIDKLINHALFENLFSDCEVVHQGMSRTFLKDGKQTILDGEYQMFCATATDRLAEIKK